MRTFNSEIQQTITLQGLDVAIADDKVDWIYQIPNDARHMSRENFFFGDFD